MALGTHHFQQDSRNAEILISINGVLYPRDKAMVSVFDSGFILGDGVWEGLTDTYVRVHAASDADLTNRTTPARLVETEAAGLKAEVTL